MSSTPGVRGTGRVVLGPSSSQFVPGTSEDEDEFFRFGRDEDRTRTRKILKLRDEDRIRTKLGPGPIEDEIGTRTVLAWFDKNIFILHETVFSVFYSFIYFVDLFQNKSICPLQWIPCGGPFYLVTSRFFGWHYVAGERISNQTD